MVAMQVFWVFLLIHYTLAFSAHQPLGITGGYKIAISDAPFVASMVRYVEKITKHIPLRQVCGGSIIHERFILTAAHCFLSESYRDVIRVGSSHLYNGGRTYEVDKFIMHENFTERHGFSSFAHDVALVKLKNNIVFSATVSKIALPDDASNIEPFTSVNVTGWGQTEIYGSVSMELRQAIVEINPKEECEIYPWMSEDEICVWSHYKGACKGDSGGPLTRGDVQVGIVSHGLGCGFLPSINTKVSYLRSWIIENINKNL